MEKGWCDVCLRVKSALAAKGFYEKLGFRMVEGEPNEGWAVLASPVLRLGLFEAQFMGEDTMSLNFRGLDVFETAAALTEIGFTFETGPKGTPGGPASARLRDPDGHLIFFDGAPTDEMPD